MIFWRVNKLRGILRIPSPIVNVVWFVRLIGEYGRVEEFQCMRCGVVSEMDSGGNVFLL
jgi:hypothetical protein